MEHQKNFTEGVGTDPTFIKISSDLQDVRMVSSWLTLREKTYYTLATSAEGELLRDVEADLGEELANELWPWQDASDSRPVCYRLYIELAKLYGVAEWPVRAITHYLVETTRCSVPRAQACATETWDRMLAEYEELHARRRRRRGDIVRQPATL
jgi:hypothetical protein